MECERCKENIEMVKCGAGWLNRTLCHYCSYYMDECVFCREYAETLHLLYDELGDAFICKVCGKCKECKMDKK